MKKIVVLALVVVFALGFVFTGCAGGTTADGADAAGNADAAKDASADDEGLYEIALVTDMMSIDDKGFNQGTWEGIVRYAEENGISHQYYRPIEQSVDGYLTSIETAINDGAKLVICPGFTFEPAVFKAQELYPDVKFIILDGRPQAGDYVEYHTAENTYSVIYAEEQAGFLAGYAAVIDGYRELGFLGGMAVPAVVRFGYGYVQGAEYAAKELGLAAGDINIKYGYTGSFDALPEYQTKAASWYESGTEVILACGITASVAAAAEGSDSGKTIGVDIDQSGESDTIITSAMKMLSNTVYDGITAYYAGSFPGGVDAVLGAADNAIGLPADFSRMNSFDQAKYDEIFAALANDTDGVASGIVKDVTEDGTAIMINEIADTLTICTVEEIN